MKTVMKSNVKAFAMGKKAGAKVSDVKKTVNGKGKKIIPATRTVKGMSVMGTGLSKSFKSLGVC